MKIRTRLLTKHQPGCGSVESTMSSRWDSPWFFTEEVVDRDKAGTGRGRSERWRVCRCNTIGCPAEMIVSENDILAAAVASDGKAYHCQQIGVRPPRRHRGGVGT